MKVLFVVAAVCCLGVIATEDSLAMESEVNIQKVKRHHPEAEIGGYQIRPGKTYVRGKLEKGRRALAHREREARGQEESWKPYYKQGPVYELPRGFEIDGKYFEEPKHRYQQVEEQTGERVPYVAVPKGHKEEGENLRVESSQHPGLSSGSYLNHIKEQMNDGKLLGYSSFVEHFSENDDAEELKTAMREGSLEDIKKLVPKSVVSFQMYHGGEEQKVIKTEPLAERKPEVTWNEIPDWPQPSPTPWTQPQAHYVKSVPHKYVIAERKKRPRKHPERYRPTYHYQTEESREEIQTTTSPEPEPPKVTSNEVYEKEAYPEIVQSISYEIPSDAFKTDTTDYEVASSESVSREQDRQETRSTYNRYVYDSEHSTWTPIGEKPTAAQAASQQHKVISTPKPPETSKLYYEHFKTKANTQETSKFSQLPKIGQVVSDNSKQTPETYYLKKPVRVKPISQSFSKRQTTPSLASGEDFNQRFAQIPTASPSATRISTTRYWSKPDTTNHQYQQQKRLSTPIKLEKILNKQAEVHPSTEKQAKDGNIFLTKQFQSEISDFFSGGKSDLEWIPSTHVRYDARPSSPVSYVESTEPSKPKKYRIYRSERNPGVPGPKNVVFLGPETQQSPDSFSVSASYQIDKNRRNGE